MSVFLFFLVSCVGAVFLACGMAWALVRFCDWLTLYNLYRGERAWRRNRDKMLAATDALIASNEDYLRRADAIRREVFGA